MPTPNTTDAHVTTFRSRRSLRSRRRRRLDRRPAWRNPEFWQDIGEIIVSSRRRSVDIMNGLLELLDSATKVLHSLRQTATAAGVLGAVLLGAGAFVTRAFAG